MGKEARINAERSRSDDEKRKWVRLRATTRPYRGYYRPKTGSMLVEHFDWRAKSKRQRVENGHQGRGRHHSSYRGFRRGVRMVYSGNPKIRAHVRKLLGITE